MYQSLHSVENIVSAAVDVVLSVRVVMAMSDMLLIAGIVFSALEAGEHKVHVRRAGSEISGSPFSVMISECEVCRVDGVKVYGRGLTDAVTSEPAQFYIDTSHAGQQHSLTDCITYLLLVNHRLHLLSLCL